jgi:hypothetical protein
MSKYTEHLGLVQPAGNEYYDVEQFNHNAELIDKEAKRLSTELAKVQEGATREKAGIVQYGTTEGKALEGMMLARLAGCVAYSGDIQEPGVKDINYIYYDRNTRKMYKCINQNSDISANVANFIPLDNNSLLERLENLISSKTEGNNRILKIGNVVIENISIPGSTGIRTAKLKTSFKNIIFVSLTPYITYGQEVDSAQVLHDNNEYIIKNKSLRFYCNGHQTVDICVIGLI